MRFALFLAVLALAPRPSWGLPEVTNGRGASLVSQSTLEPADTGVVRLGNSELACWEANTPGVDLCIGFNSSDRLGLPDTELQAPWYVTADISDTLAGNQNNYEPTGIELAAVLRLTASGASRTITGLRCAAGTDCDATHNGRIMFITNVGGSNNIVLADESGSSSAGNRFALTGALTILPDEGVALIYDGTSLRWRSTDAYANTGVVANSYGDPAAGVGSILNVNAQGRVTGGGTAAIAIGASQVTGGAFSGVTLDGNSNDIQTRRHATDCTGLTDGKAGEQCYEQDADTLWVCEPTAGDCDTAGEWRQITGGSGLGDPGSNGLVARTALNTTVARSIDVGAPLAISNANGVSGNPTISYTAIRDPRADGAVCDGATDDTAALNTAAGTAGRQVVIPHGSFCKVSGTVTLADDVGIRCEGTSGFTLATKVCVGGTYAGASCANSGQCAGGGTCSGTAFAPTSGTTYRVLESASGSTANVVDGCTFLVNGVDGYHTCTGGSNNGQPCRNTCAGGTNAGKLCTVNGNCPGSTCTMDTVCTGGGTCTGVAGIPSGSAGSGVAPSSGSVVIADFRNASKASAIVGNVVYDPRKLGAALVIGPNGQLEDNTVGVTSPLYNTKEYVSHPGWEAPPLASAWPHTDGVLTTHNNGIVTENVILGYTSGVGISALSATNLYIAANTVQASAIATSGYGYAGSGGGVGRIANNLFANLGWGIYTLATDLWVVNNTLSANLVGVAASGAGVHVETNNLLFAGAITLSHATATFATGTGHSTVKGNFCASLGPCDIAYAQQAKRCCATGSNCATSAGTKQFQTCTVDGDCTGANPSSGSCKATTIDNTDISNNTAYVPTSAGAIDVSAAAANVSDNGFALDKITIANNVCQGGTNCLKFPTTGTAGEEARRCKGGANLNASCALATCSTDCGAGATCPADCVPLMTGVVAGNAAIGTTTPVTNWFAEYGAFTNNHNLGAGDPATLLVYATNKTGSTSVLYEAVTSDASTTNGVTQAPASTQRPVLGVWTAEAANNAVAAIATQGVTKCGVTSAAVAVGDRLCVSSTAGKGTVCPAGRHGYAVALEANASTAKNISCLVNGGAPPAPEPLRMMGFAGFETCGNGTEFMGPTGGCNATETNVDYAIDGPMVVKQFGCRQTVDTSCTITFTLRDDANDTTAACTTTNADSCEATGLSVSIAAGSLVAVEVVDTGANCTSGLPVDCWVVY